LGLRQTLVKTRASCQPVQRVLMKGKELGRLDVINCWENELQTDNKSDQMKLKLEEIRKMQSNQHNPTTTIFKPTIFIKH